MINTNWLAHTNISIDGFEDTLNNITQGETPIDISNKSTRGNESLQFSLNNYFKDIKNITNTVTQQLKRIEPLQNKKFNLLEGWTVYGRQGGYHMVHNHGILNHVSVVIYLKTPKQEGQFYYFLLNNNEIECDEIQPEEGMMIVMPTKTLHGSYPQAKGLRHTLNLDFEMIE